MDVGDYSEAHESEAGFTAWLEQNRAQALDELRTSPAFVVFTMQGEKISAYVCWPNASLVKGAVMELSERLQEADAA